jgi:hypothetical protein
MRVFFLAFSKKIIAISKFCSRFSFNEKSAIGVKNTFAERFAKNLMIF